jgi:deferrochelatase/peroxidase EfeB
MPRGVVAIVQAFLAMNGTMQNDVFGRTKKESNELPNPPLTSHMVRVKQSNFGYFLGTPP